MFDLAKHVTPHFIRKKSYPDVCGTAIITGASSGCGRELTKLYADKCNRIYVTARNMDALNELKDELANQCDIIPIKVDFGKEDAIDTIKTCIEDSKINMLLNNAGHHVRGSLLDVDLEIIKSTIQINFFSHIELMVAYPETSTVVNILSTTAVSGRRNLGAYSSTKAGLWCFSKAMRRTKGITQNVIDVIPATFKSSLTEKGERGENAQENQGNTKLSSSRDGLDSFGVAQVVKDGIDKKKDTIYIPNIKTRMFIVLEALASGRFRKIFK